MPFMDGYALARKIREHEAGGDRYVPIVALTANALKDESAKCHDAGMDGIMSKPVELSRLDSTLLRWMPIAKVLRTVHEEDAVKPATMEAAASFADDGSSNGSTPVDLRVLAEVLGSDDIVVLGDTLKFFLTTVEGTPSKLAAYLNEKNDVALRDEAHAAKGASASAGAKKLANLLMTVQSAAEKRDWPQMENLVPQVASEMASVRDYIQNL